MKLRVLYAEDNDLVRDMTQQVLKAHLPDATLTVVENSDNFLANARSNKYDIYFSDNDVPQANSGLDSILQRRVEGDYTPAIIYTGGVGYDEIKEDPDCARFNIIPLRKPYNPAQLIQLIKTQGGYNDAQAA